MTMNDNVLYQSYYRQRSPVVLELWVAAGFWCPFRQSTSPRCPIANPNPRLFSSRIARVQSGETKSSTWEMNAMQVGDSGIPLPCWSPEAPESFTVRALIAINTAWFRSRLSLQLEIVALRHQLTVLSEIGSAATHLTSRPDPLVLDVAALVKGSSSDLPP